MSADQDATIKSSQEAVLSTADLPDRYAVKKIIGRGGMGVVLLAHDTVLGRDVAVKMLLFEGAKEAGSVQRFEREARALAALNHPNIVKIHSWGVGAGGNPYHVMEFLNGEALTSRIGEGKPMEPRLFFEIFSAVLSALSHAHEQQVVHRDIKPSNIFLCQANEQVCPKLIDFGIVRFQDPQSTNSKTLTATNLLLGSPTYMSPEQCKGSKAEQSSDIYSLACVMYESLSGRPPHKGDSAMEVMYKHMTKQAASLEKSAADPAARRLGRLIDRCLSIDPAKRPQSAKEVLAELAEIKSEMLDLSGSLFMPVSERRKNDKAMAAGLALLAIGVLSGVAMLVLQSDLFSARKQSQSALSGEDALLRNSIRNLEQHFQQAKGLSKKHFGQDLLKTIFELAESRRKRGDFKNALKVLDRAMEISNLIEDRYWDNRAQVLAHKLVCYLDSHDYQQAEQTAGQGLACTFRDKHFAWAILPYFAKERAKVRILKHDFAGAKNDVLLLIKRAYYHDPLFEKGILGDEDQSEGMVAEISGILARQEVKEAEERISALDLHTVIVSHVVEKHYQSGGTVENMLVLLRQFPKDDASISKPVSQAYGLASAYYDDAASNTSGEEQNKYKKLSEKYRRMSQQYAALAAGSCAKEQ